MFPVKILDTVISRFYVFSNSYYFKEYIHHHLVYFTGKFWPEIIFLFADEEGTATRCTARHCFNQLCLGHRWAHIYQQTGKFSRALHNLHIAEDII